MSSVEKNKGPGYKTSKYGKLEKADAQISIGSVILFLFNGFGPKRSVHVFAK